MLTPDRGQLLFGLFVVVSALLAEPLRQPAEHWLPASGDARVYAERALRTQRFTAERLAHPAPARGCGSAAYIGYARELGSRLSDAWHDASQVLADAAMVRLGQSEQTCALMKTVAFLDFVARPGSAGGFYPRADVDGTNATTRDTFADDNALIGLALLEARGTSTDGVWRAALLERASSAARFLIEGGLWDDTFGGGFWWNSGRGQMGEGKPAQTTALAAQLFARLYQETGDRRYADWARACLAWLEARLFDPTSGLYRYTVRHWDVRAERGVYVEPRFFGYDQGIMIEVHLLFEQALEPEQGHLDRATELGERTQDAFWDHERGGYHLEAGRAEIYTAYSAWLTQPLLALYAADPRPAWLTRARANLEALERYLLDPASGGYHHMQYRCPGLASPGCEHGAAWSYDPAKLLFSQAWMQRGQALLAAHLAEAP